MNSPSSQSIATWPVVPDLTDEQWQRVAPLLPEALSDRPRRGRPPIDIRLVLNSVMWVLHTRAPWSAMPEHCAPYQTAHRYYLRWKRSGVLSAIMLALFKTDDAVATRATRRAARARGSSSQSRR
ncbi:transposase [Paraburkholderia monticola]|uniref:Transposase n=1 Tax=Paraburkholderia monticola TaxID=1399968 RepID=A0A149PPI1_9BURK|nr:transposase [Paraburkholderia monticola]KXU86980.1 transposase [Paraburkholderia monticola]